MKAARFEVVKYLNDLLRIKEFEDFTLNGLEVEGTEEIAKVGFAVDACIDSFEALKDCQMICVHHGFIWKSLASVTDINRRRIKFLLDRDINLYVCHLPLDRHPQVGNNAQILKKLGWEATGEFDKYGWLCDLEEPVSKEEAFRRLNELFPNPRQLFPYGSDTIRRIGVCSGGGGGSYFTKAMENGLDLYITGETDYRMYHESKERGMNVACVGHYNSETFGVLALKEYIEKQFGLETAFADVPTGI
ncbi:Nif3-like dinuclear metal center hexameric protein [bacterium]|nr:Nif3-like dinuclear metal center hexameric protein [bacterium]